MDTDTRDRYASSLLIRFTGRGRILIYMGERRVVYKSLLSILFKISVVGTQNYVQS